MKEPVLLRVSRSRALSLLVLAGIFLLLFLCTHWTDLVADDYRYCFSYADGSRIRSVAQIFPSMEAHRQSMNGRVVAHFLVQLFLMLPKVLFDLINALLFTLLVWLTAHAVPDDRTPNALLLITVFACLWCLQPDFGQVFLWLDGSVNYLWCGVLSLLWLQPWTRQLLRGEEPSGLYQALYVLFSLSVGAYSENASVALIAMGLFFLLARALWERKKPAAWTLLSLAAAFAGFLYMMLAPAEQVNKSADMTLSVLFVNFLDCAGYYLRFWPLLLSLALLYALACRRALPLRRRLCALIYLLGSLAGHFVLTFALYTAGRSTYISLLLLLAANTLLFVPLFAGDCRGLLAGLCCLCILFAAWRIPVGLADIRRTHEKLRYNEELLADCAARGEREVQLPRPYALTSYSALEGLPYLNLEDPEDWPNSSMAKYYGVDIIRGY